MKKICFFNRSSVHYRKNIWMLMDQEMTCDFYFGDSRPGKIEYLDVSLLRNFKGYFHNINIGPFCWQKGSLNLLKSNYSDIITDADTYCLSIWPFIFRARNAKKSIWLWVHGAFGNEGWFKKWLIKQRISRAKGVFLYGKYARDILIKWGIAEDKLHVIYNSLSYDEQLVIRQQLKPTEIYQQHFGNSNPNIVFIGRLTKVKKLDQILKAVKILKEQGKEFNISFVGDGVTKTELILLSEQLGLKKQIWFYGACYDEKLISDFIYNADICVSPGNVGLTAMHAMSFGCPVISHNNFPMQMPEFEAIEEGKTGAFFIENDVESLAKSIYEWFKKNTDRDQVRQACYKVIDDKYNPHVQIEIMKRVILGG